MLDDFRREAVAGITDFLSSRTVRLSLIDGKRPADVTMPLQPLLRI
jgi:hypothetical protein